MIDFYPRKAFFKNRQDVLRVNLRQRAIKIEGTPLFDRLLVNFVKRFAARRTKADQSHEQDRET